MCDKCGASTHRDDAMNRRCDDCERLVRQCICTPRVDEKREEKEGI